MKKILAALLFLCTLSIFAQSTPALKAEQHKATFTIVTINSQSQEGAGCSATALSEHVLLTAAHCRILGGKVYLNQTSRPWNHPLDVSETFYDNQDHMLLVLPGVSFKHFVKYDPANYKQLARTERYYLWGNLGMLPDQYREGYVTGFLWIPNEDEVMVSSPITVLSGPVVGGDSGSGIFAEDGRLVGVLTWGIEDGAFAGMYPLAFTSEQLAQAEGFGTFTYEPLPPVVSVVIPPAQAVPTMNCIPLFLIGAACLVYILPPILKVRRRLFYIVGVVALYTFRLIRLLFTTAIGFVKGARH